MCRSESVHDLERQRHIMVANQASQLAQCVRVQCALDEVFDEGRIVRGAGLAETPERTVRAGADEAEESVLLGFDAYRVLHAVEDAFQGGFLGFPEVEELVEATHHHVTLAVEEQAAGLR